jgi:hypothetical protein
MTRTRNFVRFALGPLIIAATFAVASPANARVAGRWVNFVNKDRPAKDGGPFFLGVAGGCSDAACTEIKNGARIIVWANTINDGKNHDDQKWTTPDTGIGFVTNFFHTNTPQQGVLSIQYPNPTEAGRPVIVRDADPQITFPDQKWQIVPAESYGATAFAGCFVFRNNNSSMVAGVQSGQVFSGANVIQWGLFVGLRGSTSGWHPDQFWCPVD